MKDHFRGRSSLDDYFYGDTKRFGSMVISSFSNADVIMSRGEHRRLKTSVDLHTTAAEATSILATVGALVGASYGVDVLEYPNAVIERAVWWLAPIASAGLTYYKTNSWLERVREQRMQPLKESLCIIPDYTHEINDGEVSMPVYYGSNREKVIARDKLLAKTALLGDVQEVDGGYELPSNPSFDINPRQFVQSALRLLTDKSDCNEFLTSIKALPYDIARDCKVLEEATFPPDSVTTDQTAQENLLAWHADVLERFDELRAIRTALSAKAPKDKTAILAYRHSLR